MHSNLPRTDARPSVALDSLYLEYPKDLLWWLLWACRRGSGSPFHPPSNPLVLSTNKAWKWMEKAFLACQLPCEGGMEQHLLPALHGPLGTSEKALLIGGATQRGAAPPSCIIRPPSHWLGWQSSKACALGNRIGCLCGHSSPEHTCTNRKY